MVVFPSQEVQFVFDFMEEVLNWTKYHEYYFFTHLTLLFESLVVQT
jgi:hypothetical protein